MTIILIWIVTSAAVGWFGRKRVIGFWGFFVLSLIVSPVVTGLFLLIGAPSKQYMAETEQRVAASFRRAGFVPAREARAARARTAAETVTEPAVHVGTPGVKRLALAWLVVVGVFALLYLIVGAQGGGLALTGGMFGLADALRVSLDVGTLGSGGDGMTASLSWLASLERLLVLVILLLMLSTLISAQMAAYQARRNGSAAQEPPPPEPASPGSPLAAAREPAPLVVEPAPAAQQSSVS